jgi:hypothetical protein
MHMVDSGARRQKRRSLKMALRPTEELHGTLGTGGGGSGTTKKMISAVAAVTPAITSIKPRQPIYAKSHAAGDVAHIAPNVPSMMKQPLNRSMRSFGNHDTMALSPAINAPATPKPIKARPTTSAAN